MLNMCHIHIVIQVVELKLAFLDQAFLEMGLFDPHL